MPSTTSGAHVLLAEAIAADGAGCETAIRRAGHRCTKFRDGESAAAALRVCEFDVIVTDPRMPGNENLEVLRAQREWSPRTPTIVVTAQPTLGTAILALRLGAIDYLLKPIQAGGFVEVLERALSQSRNLRSLRDLRARMQDEQQLLERLEGVLSTIEPRLHHAEHLPRSRTERRASAPDLLVGLSKREIQILDRFSGGDRAPAIARDLGISPHTVRNHLKAIFGKLGVRSQLELARKLSDRQPPSPALAANR
ncbi:MAG: response regulator [Myxococcales bacterium]|nr:response regulator [Myxococcales bacterium]